jgi:hypothetical protein
MRINQLTVIDAELVQHSRLIVVGRNNILDSSMTKFVSLAAQGAGRV